MKIFVMGTSGIGKTPFAKRVAEGLALPHIGASAWVRRLFTVPSGLSREEQVAAMTAFSTKALAEDPDACLRHLRSEPALAGACVIEGIRNPRDFSALWDPRKDLAIFLRHTAVAPTAFERGLEVIEAYVRWSIANGLAPKESLRELSYTYLWRAEGTPNLDDLIDETIATVNVPDAALRGAFQSAAHVHSDIPPLRLLVHKALLYGGDERYRGQYLSCRAFVVSSYPGSAPTFKILLDDGAVFSYVPPSALFETVPTAPELALQDLVYSNCPTGDFCVHHFAMLEGEVHAFFKHKNLWLKGRYILTLDWYEGNDLLHLVALENGQIAFLPHHKLKFGDHEEGFEPYKKLRAEWKVGKA
jgi:hypothetical protein